jgi:uncharacterized membrane protein
MTKNDFLKRLSANLSRMSKDEQAEIMADFNEYFVCAAKEGKDEATACSSLGDPKKIAREYYSQKMIEEANQKKTFKSMGRAVFASAGLSIVNFFYAICIVAVGYIVIASLYIAVCSAGLSGLAVLVGAIVCYGVMGAAFAWLGIFAGLGLAALCVLGFIGIMKLAGLFKRGNMRFLNMTGRGIKGGIKNE